MSEDTLHHHAVAIYRAAVAAADPGRCLARCLDRDGLEGTETPALLSIGKASVAMAQAAVAWLESHGRGPRSVLVVGPRGTRHQGLDFVAGDHPVPGEGSREAAEAVRRMAEQLAPGTPVWVLLSGGGTSMMADPLEPLTLTDLVLVWQAILDSGLPIDRANSIRKKLVRYGGGRLASLLRGRSIRCYALSDVPGDRLSDIASGPCVPDPDPGPLPQLLLDGHIWDRLPEGLQDKLSLVARDAAVGDREGIPSIASSIIGNNATALQGAAREATARGFVSRVASDPLSGEAAPAGRRLARELLKSMGSGPCCLLWGGETTVTLDESHGTGGRCQELALAGAEELSGLGKSLVLLAAGTDGRDGPTDAAGAVVDGTSWEAMRLAGADPSEAARLHASHDALASAGCLFQPGETGTNVMDVVIGLVR